ncbi:MAG: hypothetical protein M1837_004520 [Sclerophora amabilis]|nr:MAG: hypothetical protein M1837_004520 [Sclerophora amabilis]
MGAPPAYDSLYGKRENVVRRVIRRLYRRGREAAIPALPAERRTISREEAGVGGDSNPGEIELETVPPPSPTPPSVPPPFVPPPLPSVPAPAAAPRSRKERLERVNEARAAVTRTAVSHEEALLIAAAWELLAELPAEAEVRKRSGGSGEGEDGQAVASAEGAGGAVGGDGAGAS